jgi:lysophospholipase L1-like esterase
MKSREPLQEPGSAAPVFFVAAGDSFTEGLNDPAPGGAGFRGWADRLADMLTAQYPGLRYANLAVRGKLLRQIVSDQVPAALTLVSDRAPGTTALVSIVGGGNDILRPGTEPDTIADMVDAAVARFRGTGCEVMLFTGFDPLAFPVMRLLRGKIATFNMHLRAIADDRDCYLVDLWSMKALRDPRAWSADRLHLTADSHRRIALRACETLGVPVAGDWRAPLGEPVAAPGLSKPDRAAWLAARRQDARWAREHFFPWVNRRIHGRSSGDGRLPKRPSLDPVTPLPDERP